MNQEFIEKIFNAQIYSPKTRKYIRYFLYIIWGAGLLLILWSGWRNWYQITPLLEQANYSNFFFAAIYYLLGLSAAILLWLTIIRTFRGGLGWWKDLQIYCVTFAARRLPGTIWYVGGRLLLYQKMGVSRFSVLFASLIELITGYLAAGIVGLGIFFVIGEDFSPLISFVMLLFVLAGLFVTFPLILKKLVKSNQSGPPFFARIFDWLVWIFSSVTMWIFGGIMVIQLVKIFNPDLTSRENIYIIGAWAISGLIGLLTYFLPSSFGATELSLTVFLTQVLPFSLAGLVAISTRLFTLVMDVLLAAIFYPVVMRLSPDISKLKEDLPLEVPIPSEEKSASINENEPANILK